MRPLKLSGAACASPAVSTTLNSRSPRCALPSRRSRVTPGLSSTRAIRLRASRLNSVDLPTFGRPTMATVKLMTEWAVGRHAGAPSVFNAQRADRAKLLAPVRQATSQLQDLPVRPADRAIAGPVNSDEQS